MGQIRTDQIGSGQIRSDRIRSDQIRSDQIRSNHTLISSDRSDHIRSHQITSHHIRSDQTRSSSHRTSRKMARRLHPPRCRGGEVCYTSKYTRYGLTKLPPCVEACENQQDVVMTMSRGVAYCIGTTICSLTLRTSTADVTLFFFIL